MPKFLARNQVLTDSLGVAKKSNFWDGLSALAIYMGHPTGFGSPFTPPAILWTLCMHDIYINRSQVTVLPTSEPPSIRSI